MFEILYTIYNVVDTVVTSFLTTVVMGFAWIGGIAIIFEIFGRIDRVITYYARKLYTPDDTSRVVPRVPVTSNHCPACVCHLLDKKETDKSQPVQTQEPNREDKEKKEEEEEVKIVDVIDLSK